MFKIDPTGHESLLHSFTGPSADGANPYEGVTRDSAGRLYGLTYFFQTLYELQPSATFCAGVLCPWNESILSNIPGGGDYGGFPTGIPVVDAQGNVYATSEAGGSGTNCGGAGCGFVFKVDPQGQFTVIYNFNSQGGSDGFFPTGPLLLLDGSLYGTTVVVALARDCLQDRRQRQRKCPVQLHWRKQRRRSLVWCDCGRTREPLRHHAKAAVGQTSAPYGGCGRCSS